MRNFIRSKEAIIIAVLVFTFMLLTYARYYVSSFYNEDQGFEWIAKAQTSKDLPIMFADCDFHHTGYDKGNCESNVMLYGDRTDTDLSCGGSGDDRRDLYPDSLKLLYYSFSERKFYAAATKLNYDSVLSIAAKMRNEVQLEETKRTESIVFKATVYPMGKVVVSMESYINTSIGEVVVARLQAKPEEHDWSVFSNGGSSDKKGISQSNSVATQRALLLNKYNWQLEMLLPKDHVLNSLDVALFGNGGLKMDTIKNAETPTFGNFFYMPQELSVSWARKDTIGFYAGFEFDELEMIKAFSAIDTPGGKRPITMQIIAQDDTTALRAVIHGGNKSFKLKNSGSGKIHTERIYH